MRRALERGVHGGHRGPMGCPGFGGLQAHPSPQVWTWPGATTAPWPPSAFRHTPLLPFASMASCPLLQSCTPAPTLPLQRRPHPQATARNRTACSDSEHRCRCSLSLLGLSVLSPLIHTPQARATAHTRCPNASNTPARFAVRSGSPSTAPFPPGAAIEGAPHAKQLPLCAFAVTAQLKLCRTTAVQPTLHCCCPASPLSLGDDSFDFTP